MRALRVGDRTSLVDVPIPAADGEALVRVTLSGICNTDLELARGYMGFRGTLGHELVGVVEEGSDLAKGTRVVCEINAGCGSCPLCQTGDSRHCPTRTVMGIVGRDGAHADYLRIPARNLIAVPDGISDRQAVFVEPLAAALGILERCPISGERVAIIGDGKLGLLIAMALADHRPLLIGKHLSKMKLAPVDSMLVEHVHAHAGGKFDIVIEASGTAAGFTLALDLLRPQGSLVLKSTFAGSTPVDAGRIVIHEIRVVGSRCGRFAPALARLPHVNVDRLISDQISIDHAAQTPRSRAS